MKIWNCFVSVFVMLWERVQLLTKRIEPKVTLVVDHVNGLLGKPVSRLKQMIILLAIKYLYMFLIVMILKDQWYIGYGSYGIDFNVWKEILGTLFFVGVSLIYLNVRINDLFVDCILYFLFVLYYIPLNSAFSINNQPLLYFLSSNVYFLLLILGVSFSSKWIQKCKENKHIQLQGKTKKLLYWDRNLAVVCGTVCCLFIIYKLFYNGLSFSLSVGNEELYANRAEHAAFLDSISGTFISYLLSIIRNASGVLAPLFCLISMLKKNWKHAALGFICMLAMYSVSSGKGTLLTIAIIIMLFICARLKLLKHFKRIFEVAMLALMVVCMLEHFVLQSDRIFTLLVRRMMYYPAWLSTMYYDFFMKNGPVLWTQNVFLLQNIFTPVYDQAPLTLISNAYYAGHVPSPNTGMFGEAIMHANLFGVLIYPVLLTVLLQVCAWVYKKYGTCVQMFFAITLTLHLQNVPIVRTDSVLSYWFCTFLLWILPLLYWENVPKRLQGFFSRKK